jgi:hypothetical protein
MDFQAITASPLPSSPATHRKSQINSSSQNLQQFITINHIHPHQLPKATVKNPQPVLHNYTPCRAQTAVHHGA